MTNPLEKHGFNQIHFSSHQKKRLFLQTERLDKESTAR